MKQRQVNEKQIAAALKHARRLSRKFWNDSVDGRPGVYSSAQLRGFSRRLDAAATALHLLSAEWSDSTALKQPGSGLREDPVDGIV